MNLGQAVAVCLYELIRSGSARAQKEKVPPAKERERERLTLLLLQVLDASGYLNPRASARAEEKARRLVHRLQLSAADAAVLLGMLRQISWKLGKSSDK
jgi:tRNA/rRNA methyltransferase